MLGLPIRSVLEPRMHCPQISIEGKPLCMAHHTGYCVQGSLRVQMADGSILEVAANDVYDIPPGHNGMANGSEPTLTVNWAGARTCAKSPCVKATRAAAGLARNRLSIASERSMP